MTIVLLSSITLASPDFWIVLSESQTMTAVKLLVELFAGAARIPHDTIRRSNQQLALRHLMQFIHQSIIV